MDFLSIFFSNELVILLPNLSVTLPRVLLKLFTDDDDECFFKLIKQKAYKKTPVDLKLPQFRIINENIVLREQLRVMGLVNIFDAEKADISPVSKRRGTYLSSLIHKSVFEVGWSVLRSVALNRLEWGEITLFLLKPQQREFPANKINTRIVINVQLNINLRFWDSAFDFQSSLHILYIVAY